MQITITITASHTYTPNPDNYPEGHKTLAAMAEIDRANALDDPSLFLELDDVNLSAAVTTKE